MKPPRKRLAILHQSEIQDLFGPPRLTIEEKRFYFTLNDLELKSFASIRDRQQCCYFIVLLGYFKVKPVMLNVSFTDVREDLDFVRAEYLPGTNTKRQNLTKSQRSRIYQRVFEHVGYRAYSRDCQSGLVAHTAKTAAASIDARYLFDNCIHYLAHNKIAIPKYYLLQQLVSSAINNERQRLGNILASSMSGSLASTLDVFLNSDSAAALATIRRSAKSFTAPELQKELKTHHHIAPIIEDIDGVVQRLDLSLSNLDYFASMVEYYTITKLRRFDRSLRQLYIICYLHVKYRQVIEHLADGFIFHCRKLQNNGKVYADEAEYREWQGAISNVTKAARLLRFFIDDSIDESEPFGAVRQRATSIIAPKNIEAVCLYLADQKRSQGYYIWEYYDLQRDVIDNLLRPIFLALQFQSSEATDALRLQIEHSQSDIQAHGIINHADRRLIKPRHQPFISPGGTLNPRRYEILLYLLIHNKLDGHLYIPRCLKYRCLADDLVADEPWKDKDSLIKRSLLPTINADPNTIMQSMKQELTDKLEQIGQRIQNGDNRNVVLRSRSGKTQWRFPSKGVKSMLNNPFFEQLEQVNVADLLRFVDQETDFIGSFEHVRKVQANQNLNSNNLIAAIIANGTNYGLYRMAHISDRTYEQLRSTQANYLRMESLNKANDVVSNAIANLKIFQHYNIQENVLHASADGQKFESRLHTFKTRYSSKYFRTKKGVSAMTMVANHVPVNARVIGANEHESHYIFDLLFNNTSEIQPDILSTDTHGVNHVNFALLDLFGYKFAPRYANFGSVIEDMFTVNTTDDDRPVLSLKNPIRASVIEQEWETIQRIVISLQQKTTTQASLIRKLSGYSKHHPLLHALTEYNRMVKAIYILDYIDDASLRGYVQRALNRGEAYHQLRRAVASVNGNRFRGSSDQEIDIWNECARLLTNTVIYFNSLILSNLLAHYSEMGDEVNLELIKKVSPVAWLNVNLNGTYSFTFEQNMINMADVLSPLTGKRRRAKK
jgi:TnpA family transposase